MTEIELLRKQVAELMDRVLELEKDQRRIVQYPIRDAHYPIIDWTLWPPRPPQAPTWAASGTGTAPPKPNEATC